MNENLGNVTALKAHLALNVKDATRSIEFYQKLFGIAPSKVRTGYAKFDVPNPPLNFTLNEVAFETRGALSHLGIQVATTEDVMAVRQKWIDAELLPRDEMQTSCCYALQDKAWVSDPDGNEWEVFVVLQDNVDKTTVSDKPASAAQSACATDGEAANAVAGNCCAPPAPVGITR